MRFATLLFFVLNFLTGAEAAILEFDYDSFNRGGGSFVVDTSTLSITSTAITTGPGLLGGADYTHYNGGSVYPFSGTSALQCSASCEAIFTTQGSGASFGLVTLTLSFASVLDDSFWSGPQPVGILELHSRGVPAVGDVAATGLYQGVGTIQRTILVADPIATAVPEPSTWAMLLIGFAGTGFAVSIRRHVRQRRSLRSRAAG
jgi:hypothetical protein